MVNEYLEDVAAMQAQIRRKRRITIVIVTLLGLSPILICVGPPLYFAAKDAMRERYSLTDAEKEEARAAIAGAPAVADAADRAFREALVAAFEQRVGSRPDLGRCPYSVPRARNDDLSRRLQIMGADLGYRVVPAEGALDALRALRSRAGIDLRSRASQMSSELEGEWLDPARPREVLTEARALRRPGWRFEVVFVERVRREAVGSTTTHDFTPGLVMGTAYLYAYPASEEGSGGEVACAAEIVAESSEQLDYEWTEQGLLDIGAQQVAMGRALRADLDRQVQNAISAGLRWRAGSPVEVPTEDVPAEQDDPGGPDDPGEPGREPGAAP